MQKVCLSSRAAQTHWWKAQACWRRLLVCFSASQTRNNHIEAILITTTSWPISLCIFLVSSYVLNLLISVDLCITVRSWPTGKIPPGSSCLHLVSSSFGGYMASLWLRLLALHLCSDFTPSFILLSHWPKAVSLLTNGNKTYSQHTSPSTSVIPRDNHHVFPLLQSPKACDGNQRQL